MFNDTLLLGQIGFNSCFVFRTGSNQV